MTIEQLIEEEISTDRQKDSAEKPIRVAVDEQTGDFELVTLTEDRLACPETALRSYIH